MQAAGKFGIVIVVVLACIGGYVGYDYWKLSSVGSCVSDAEGSVTKLKELPNKFSEKTAALQKELGDYKDHVASEVSDLKSQAANAAMSFDVSKASELKDKVVQISNEAKEKEESISTRMGAIAGDLKKETCDDAKQIPDAFKSCLSYLDGNVVLWFFKPAGVPDAADVAPYIDSAKNLAQGAGCDASTVMNLMLAAQAYNMDEPWSPAGFCGLAVVSAMIMVSFILARRRDLAGRDVLQQPLMA